MRSNILNYEFDLLKNNNIKYSNEDIDNFYK